MYKEIGKWFLDVAGLLSMYVALMLLGLGMIVFSKIEDNKKGK